MQPSTCDACRQPTVAHDCVNYGSMEGGYRQLCGRCFNEAAASRLGLQGFEHVVFEPVRMVDERSSEHECLLSLAHRAMYLHGAVSAARGTWPEASGR